jgi:preprotein translocase subunit SecA
MKLLSKLIGDPNEKEIKRLGPVVAEINALEPEMTALSDEDLRAKTDEFKARYAEGESLDDLLPEAYAVVREASRRYTGRRHFDVQLMGAIVLHRGQIAEMKTGEGKTLVAALPLYLNALTGLGSHLVTVNDYLAKWGPQYMGPGQIFTRLGLTVGVLQHESAFLVSQEKVSDQLNAEYLIPCTRREAYEADILYGTNHEFGFDYLRDNMARNLGDCVQGELSYAIVDEVDNILIDEARTPLIISGPAEENVAVYQAFARVVPTLNPATDYEVDEKQRVVTLTDSGVERIERGLGIDNIYSSENYKLTRFLDAALKAHIIYQRDKDYVVKDGEVVIVDDFTGRLMYGRRWSDGLHQAVEAKERVKVQNESVTYATITLQNYFRLYEKLAGMTGTAVTEAEEFHKIYKLEVVAIPTNRAMVREDSGDLVYRSEEGKYAAVAQEVIERHAKGQPVLVGTVSIEKSEFLAEILHRKGIKLEVLNAKQHEREAAIVAQAGREGAVTIATNMAGRGTDILLGGQPEGRDTDEWKAEHERVVELGGLHIIGTERHESRRIDNQLRGRAGRQGDPGSSRFYVSFEDDIMRRFAPEWLPGMMTKLGMDDETPIEHSWVSKAIQTAQQKVEGYNFDLRKHVVEYDDVMNMHRDVIYRERRKILEGADVRANVQTMVDEELAAIVSAHVEDRPQDEWDLESLTAQLNAIVELPEDLREQQLATKHAEEIRERVLEHGREHYEQKVAEFETVRGIQPFGDDPFGFVERQVLLQTIDVLWVEHLTAMEEMREGIGLQAYGQNDPLVMYKRESHDMFEQLKGNIRNLVARNIYHQQLQIRQNPPPPAQPGPQPPSSDAESPNGSPAAPIAPNGGNGTAASVPAGSPPPRPLRLRENREAPTADGAAPAAARTALATKAPGRNDPCPCGSGRKFKKCHGAVA